MYIGRFAPSPTGVLHYGSLLAALASYLDAKSSQGLWLVRIDDIDPPREMHGASQSILETLQLFGLAWDRDVIYQSQRYRLYQQALETLTASKQAYPCTCSRKEITQRSGHNHYDEHCFTHPFSEVKSAHAWRFHNIHTKICWTDGILGEQQRYHPDLADFILKRRDRLWAYQLAVTIDD
ncbi:MAG: glutamate--tRNA ligase family protein, partial [Oceanospirillaceae bacterium]